MELAELERAVSDNMDDPRFWAIYADALLTRDPDSQRARAILDALKGDPGFPSIPCEIEEEWCMGHLRGVALREGAMHPEVLPQLLERPEACLLQYLRLPFRELDRLQRLPRTLRRLDLTGDDPPERLDLKEASQELRELRAIALAARELPPLPSLVHLELGALVAPPSEALPRLQRLILHQPVDRSLRSLDPEALPALETLAVRATMERDQLDRLLGAPIARQLRRLEVSGPALASHARAIASRWAHLERLVIDDSLPGAQGGQRLLLRRTPEEALRATLHLNGTSVLTQVRAFEAALEALGLGAPPLQLREDLVVPRSLADPIALRMAAQTGLSVQVVRELALEERRQQELARERERERIGAWEEDEDPLDEEGFLRQQGWTQDCHQVVFTPEGFEIECGRSWLNTLEPVLTVSAPADFKPDPWPGPHRGPVPSRLVRGEKILELERPLAAYAAFRARAAAALAYEEPPDLTRWTERMLRRHGLDAPPLDLAHPYWEDWSARTRTERSARASDGRVPSFKLYAQGRWVLLPEEASRLAQALRTPLPSHHPPPELDERLPELVAFLDGPGELEVWVG